MITRRQLLDFMAAPDYRPMKRTELIAAMGLTSESRGRLNGLIGELVDDGLIIKLKRSGYGLVDRGDLLEGVIAFTRGGSAFVAIDGSDQSVFVSSNNAGTALPGDRVLLRLRSSPAHSKPGAKAEGKVLRVMERRVLTLVGTLKKQHLLWFVEPMQATIGHDIAVPDPMGAQLGDRVLVRLAAWDEPQLAPEGEIIEVIGPADNPALDTIAVMKNFDLDPRFPDDVVAEAERCTLTEADYEGRLDLRTVSTFTIDPATAKDFDDAISLERRGKLWQLGIHIADVSHYVRPGTALDREALRRGTSVYLTDQVVPMLPEQLSNGLCSLKPKVDRLAFSVMVTLDDEARVRTVEFARSVINSDVRLSYEQAMEVISGQQVAYSRFGLSAARTNRIRDAHALAQKMRRRRFQEDGALNMDLPEVRFVLGKDGRIADIEPVYHDESHQLIEEFMLLANELVARELTTRNLPHVHRVHDAPDPDRLAELADHFIASGIPVGNLNNRRAVVDLLARIADMPQSSAWTTAILRSMKRAEYSTKAIGHYGLSKQHYDHFTSPIRRYPDLLDHRILGAMIAGGSQPYRLTELDELCRHSSECERNAAEAERELTDLKRLRYFSDQIESGELKTYQAIVTDVRNFGLFVNVPKVQSIGLVPISLLSDDFYRFDQGRLELYGTRHGASFRVGTELAVQIARVDLDRRFLDFVPAPDPSAQVRPGKKTGRPPRGDQAGHGRNAKIGQRRKRK